MTYGCGYGFKSQDKHSTTQKVEQELMDNNNKRNDPWFWCGKTRAQFERELSKSAVSLRDSKFAKPEIKKVDIEAVRARKNALIKSGVLKASSDAVNTPTVITAKVNG